MVFCGIGLTNTTAEPILILLYEKSYWEDVETVKRKL